MIIPDRRYFRYFDWISFFLILTLVSIGLIFVFSSTYTEAQTFSIFFKKQLFGICFGICLYFLFSIFDYRQLCHWGYLAYLSVIALLFFTLIKGKIGMGAQRWVDLLFFRFQPSELAKLLLPAFIVHYTEDFHDIPSPSLRHFLPLLGALGISFILIAKQPDLGTALLVLFSGFILLWLAGLKKYFFIGFLFTSIFIAPLFWKVLKPYQKNRIAVFFGSGDINKERYQLEQSKIAIGSGGFFGKGLLRGTQNRLKFLPEGRTDCIFSILCEEWGFFGALLVLILYLLLFLRIIFLVLFMKNFYAQLLSIGLVMHIILSAVINISMVTGLLPIVGIPLPLMSYGISNLWVTLASLGWINGIVIRQEYIGE
jgi:rod shape determining protein RodA